MATYVLVSQHHRHQELFEYLQSTIAGNWRWITDKEQFTHHNLLRFNPKFVFIPHWSLMIPEDITQSFECIIFHMTDLPFGRGRSVPIVTTFMLMIASILFRFDASAMIGIGHAMRCFALIEQFVKQNVRCIVAAHPLPQFVADKLVTGGVEIEVLKGAIGSPHDIEQVECLIAKHQTHAVILDGYQFAIDYRRRLSQTDVRIVSFDDINTLPKLYCDMVINALPMANELGYQDSAPKAIHCLGLKYSIVRQEYLAQAPIPFSLRKQLLINFGGSDIGGLTPSVLRELQQQNQSAESFECVVVTGAGCQTSDEIAAMCRIFGYRHIHNCNAMAGLLTQTRMAICAPGSIVYELAYCRTPSIFFTIAKNQLLSAQAHQEAGWALTFDGTNSTQINQGISQALNIWDSMEKLKYMSETAGKLVDGKGVDRIVKEIMELAL